ncbi:unnamed protein product [Polarella glacialis]|uniref:Uncharacterized protein n=1 Tax=Polarella glacialis TaxID=89957 RepID=A0A813DXH6_POLGL|nr:unnamed protein product [Polarella glacialis]
MAAMSTARSQEAAGLCSAVPMFTPELRHEGRKSQERAESAEQSQASPAVQVIASRTASPSICAFGGGLKLGGADAWEVPALPGFAFQEGSFWSGLLHISPQLALARVWPGELRGVDTIGQVGRCGFTSMQQLALSTLPRLLRLGRSSRGREVGEVLDLVLGGWSLGSRPAAHAASQLEACGLTLRAVFALDDRRKLPFVATPSEPLPASSSMSITAATNNMLCASEPAPQFRISALCVDFVCPTSAMVIGGVNYAQTFQDDRELAARRALYASCVEVAILPDASHFAVGVDHAWDVSRRILGS